MQTFYLISQIFIFTLSNHIITCQTIKLSTEESGGDGYSRILTVQCTVSGASDGIQSAFWMLNEKTLYVAGKSDNKEKFVVQQNISSDFSDRIAANVSKDTMQITISGMIDEFNGTIGCYAVVDEKNILKASYNNSILAEIKTSTYSQHLSLTCPPHQHQQQLYSWYKDGVLVSWRNKLLDYQHYNLTTPASLLVFNATTENDGIYKCIWAAGTKIKTFNVSVSAPTTPTLTSTDDPQYSSLHGDNGFIVGICIAIVILLIILIATCLQKEFPVEGYSPGAIEATKDFLLCRRCKNGRQRIEFISRTKNLIFNPKAG